MSVSSAMKENNATENNSLEEDKDVMDELAAYKAELIEGIQTGPNTNSPARTPHARRAKTKPIDYAHMNKGELMDEPEDTNELSNQSLSTRRSSRKRTNKQRYNHDEDFHQDDEEDDDEYQEGWVSPPKTQRRRPAANSSLLTKPTTPLGINPKYTHHLTTPYQQIAAYDADEPPAELKDAPVTNDGTIVCCHCKRNVAYACKSMRKHAAYHTSQVKHACMYCPHKTELIAKHIEHLKNMHKKDINLPEEPSEEEKWTKVVAMHAKCFPEYRIYDGLMD